jgi:N-methylhydantoinase A
MQETASPAVVGVDIGGTFTDLVALDVSAGTVTLAKVPTSPAELQDGLRAGIAALQSAGGPRLGEVRHGTTVVTNVLLQRRFPRTALLCTRGFRDILETRRLWREHLFGHDWERPVTLIPRPLRIEVDERVGSQGEILRPLDEDQARAVARGLRDDGVESVAISFLFSFLAPAHERRMAAIVAEELPGVPVSVSSELLPQIHEYERTSTTAINALVAPVVGRYLERVDETLTATGVAGPLRMVRSDGLLMTPATAAREPVRLVMSGPAAGVQGAARLGRRLQQPNIVTLDIGGTSTDVSLIWDGEPLRTAQTDIEWNIPVRSTQVDISSIGAGGGSIAAIDLAGALLIGPESAGAVPGPACYGRGGTRATVTDALAMLGTLPAGLLGGDFRLDLEAAAMALRAGLPGYADAPAAAEAVVRVTLHKMAVLIREVTTNRGFDPRACTLFAFGGAGGAFAVDLARELGMQTAYVPPAASVFSALGASLSQVGYEKVQSLLASVADVDPALLARSVAAVEREATEALAGEGVPLVELRVAAALKYRSQPHAVDVPLPAGDDVTARLAGAVARFHDEHARQYGMRRDDAVDLVSVSATALGPDTGEWPLRAVRLATTGTQVSRPARDWHRDGELLRAVPVVELGGGAAGECHAGPCFIEDAFTSIAVPPGATASVDALGGVILEVTGGA